MGELHDKARSASRETKITNEYEYLRHAAWERTISRVDLENREDTEKVQVEEMLKEVTSLIQNLSLAGLDAMLKKGLYLLEENGDVK